MIEVHCKTHCSCSDTENRSTINKVVRLLDVKYGRTRTEKVKEYVDDLLKLQEDQYEDDDELILAMKELNQKRQELKMNQEEWYDVWMLGKMRKRRKMDSYDIQALRYVVKEGGADVIDKFKKMFKEIRVE